MYTTNSYGYIEANNQFVVWLSQPRVILLFWNGIILLVYSKQ